MKLNFITIGLLLFSGLTTSYALPTNQDLLTERKQVIEQYLLDLQKADYKDITQLFEKNGYVVSTSKGKINAKEFFYVFLPKVKSAKTESHNIFISDQDPNTLAGRFHFTFAFNSGEEENGEFVDEFVFSPNSSKLSAVYMFENMKFEVN
jgi:hypothetical protein